MSELAKKCSRCKEQKPVTEFGSNRAMRDGLSIYCKECTRGYSNRKRGYHTKTAPLKRGIYVIVNKDNWALEWTRSDTELGAVDEFLKCRPDLCRTPAGMAALGFRVVDRSPTREGGKG